MGKPSQEEIFEKIYKMASTGIIEANDHETTRKIQEALLNNSSTESLHQSIKNIVDAHTFKVIEDVSKDKEFIKMMSKNDLNGFQLWVLELWEND